MSSTAAGVDVGGTFTDVVARLDGGVVVVRKVPSTPRDQSEGVVAGLAAAGWDGDAARPAGAVVAHGTTTATNAVLERATARTVLVVTEGFRDLLEIGRQARPSLYDLHVVRPAPLVPRELVVPVRERVAADGTVLEPLTDGEVTRVVAEVRDLAPEAVVVSLLFDWVDPAHEDRLADALRAALDVPVTAAGALLPEVREYERTSTAVLNAAVQPVMGRYLARLEERLPATTVTVMASGGGTLSLRRAAREPVQTLYSGPAAGVVAAAAAAAANGFREAVAFDMGGTSTDVCLILDGRPEVLGHGEIEGLPFGTPTVAIHTVGAGGGSIAALDPGGALTVGPRSAGARPGPACYGHGGTEPTVTDAHCVLGHLRPGRPLGVGAGSDAAGEEPGGLRLDAGAAQHALGGLDLADGDPVRTAHGVLAVVRARMVRALRRVTTERGVDPSDLALVAFGGAGPLHATALARELGCRTVLVPAAAGVLSALGLLLAPARAEVSQSVLGVEDLGGAWGELDLAARRELEGSGVADVTIRRLADVRYRGQSHELRVEAATPEEAASALGPAHRAAYGYALDDPVEVVTLRSVADGPALLDRVPPPTWGEPREPSRRRLGLDGELEEVEVLHRAALTPGDGRDGPLLIEQPDTTTLIGRGEHARVTDDGTLELTWT